MFLTIGAPNKIGDATPFDLVETKQLPPEVNDTGNCELLTQFLAKMGLVIPAARSHERALCEVAKIHYLLGDTATTSQLEVWVSSNLQIIGCRKVFDFMQCKLEGVDSLELVDYPALVKGIPYTSQFKKPGLGWSRSRASSWVDSVRFSQGSPKPGFKDCYSQNFRALVVYIRLKQVPHHPHTRTIFS